MKKLFSLLVVVGMAAIIACGPSAEEKAAKEKAKQDSIAAVKKADSIAQAEKEKARQDSIAAAEKQKRIDDSLAALKNKPKTQKPQQQKPAQQNAPKGKG